MSEDPEEEATEVDDQPLGVDPELVPEDAPAPGLPESEPPSSG